MNTTQIDFIVRRCRVPNYRGVYPSDLLPETSGIMIVNLDPQGEPGTHWVGIYISADCLRGEYFDSFGRHPDRRLTDYLNKHCSNWIYNSRQLQSVASKCCGHYCIMYCINRAKLGVDLNRFVSRFTRDTGFNDFLVRKAVRLAVNNY